MLRLTGRHGASPMADRCIPSRRPECPRLWGGGRLAHRADTVHDGCVVVGLPVSPAGRPRAGCQAAPPAYRRQVRDALEQRGDYAFNARALGISAGGDAVRSTNAHVRARATDRGTDYARHWQGDDSAGDSLSACGVTPNLQRVCEESTKYPEMGMLHDLV
jgi:hypothetical protein